METKNGEVVTESIAQLARERQALRRELVDPSLPGPLVVDYSARVDAISRRIEQHVAGLRDRPLREVQRELPWGAHGYGPAYEARTDPQRNIEHMLKDFTTALGGLCKVVGELDHAADPVARARELLPEARKAFADLQWVLLQMGNDYPGGLDVADALFGRMQEKMR